MYVSYTAVGYDYIFNNNNNKNNNNKVYMRLCFQSNVAVKAEHPIYFLVTSSLSVSRTFIYFLAFFKLSCNDF